MCRKGGVLGYGPLMGNLPGTQAEFARIPFADVTLRKIPEGLSEERAIFCGDVLTTAYGAVRNAGLKPGETVAVIGCGPVGLMAVQSALAQGAARVLAIDMLADRLELARRFGAEPVDPASGSVAAQVRDLTRKAGVDVVIEAVGGPKTIALAFELVTGGGRISAVGVSNAATFEFPLMLALSRDIGFRIGLANIHRDMDATLALVQDGRIDPLPVVSHRLRLADAAQGYRLFDARQALKILLEP
jgi:threonine dehydrogenase-like Zn-dependent dehydrogenase